MREERIDEVQVSMCGMCVLAIREGEVPGEARG
jgi:hypothetical protein